MSQVDERIAVDPAAGSLKPSSFDSPPLKPLRVLHLTAGNLYGGIETFLLTLARSGALEPRISSEFGVCFPGRFREELSTTARPIHDLGPVRISRPWTVLRARRRLAALLKAVRPDRVVVHGSWTQAIFGPIVRRHGIALALFAHGPISNSSLLDRWARSVPIDLLIANSEHTLRGYEHRFSGVPRAVCRCPVEPIRKSQTARDEVRSKLGTPSSSIVIIQVSRLERWKGQHVLLQALAKLGDVPAWECWIVGGAQRPEEAVYRDELAAFAAESGCGERIKFLGHRSDVADLLQAADLFCQPNVAPEPLGIVFVEALYAGLCVITSNFGGGAELIAAECGVLTPPGDIEALTAALSEVIADSDFRRAAASAGPQRAAAICDPQTQIHRLYETLARVESRPC